MSPDFEDLVGTDLEPEERARLERVHALLLAAGPPPEPAPSAVELPRSRRRRALLALAATLAVAVAAFALGATLADGPSGRAVDYEASMDGTDAAPDADATLLVFEVDEAGNWPMELRVDGLAPRSSGRPFELWLTRGDELAALCGSFVTSVDGSAVVPMNAPYSFDDFDEWVVVERGSRAPLLTT